MRRMAWLGVWVFVLVSSVAAQQPLPLNGETASEQAYRAGEAERRRGIAGQVGLQDYIRFRAGLADRRWLYADPPGLGGNFSPTQPTIWGAIGPTLYGDGIFEPWATWPGYIYGYRYDNPVEQPAGDEITPTGPNSYTYGPVYDRTPPDYGPAPPPRLSPPPGPSVGPAPTPRPTAPSELPNELRTAIALFRAGEYGESLAELDQVLDHSPGLALARLLRVQALFGLAEYEGAAAELRQALSSLPPAAWGQGLRNYRRFYERNATFRQELQTLENHLDNRPDDAAARLLLAYEYGYLGYPRQAIGQLERLDGHAPDRLIDRLREQFESSIVAPERVEQAGPRRF